MPQKHSSSSSVRTSQPNVSGSASGANGRGGGNGSSVTTSRATASLTAKQRAQLATRTPPAATQRPILAARATSAPRGGSRGRRAKGGANTGVWAVGATLLVVLGFVIFALVKGASGTGSGSGSNITPGHLNNSNVPLAVGTTAPDFTLTSADGTTYSLNQYRGKAGTGGKVVLLEFFAPWCPHCRNETTILNQVASADSGQNVQILSITASPYGYDYEATGNTSPITQNDVDRFVRDFHITFPAILDTSLKAANDYGVIGYPQMYIIDRNGTITWNNGAQGEVSYTALQNAIQQALNVPVKQ